MREMKNSGVEWIGEMPATWTVSKLKNYIKCYDGRRVPIDSAKRVSGPYPYWGAGSITDYVDDYLFDEELILLGEDGAPFFDDTRPVAFLINEKIWANNHIHVIKPLPLINASFLVNYLNIVDYGTYINGSILSKLTQLNMNNISLVVPSLDEQHRIADFLYEKCAKIDAVIEKQKQVIEKLKEYKLSVITEAVTKGLDPTVHMKDSGVKWIGEIPEGWKITKIKNLCKLKTGTTPSTSNLEWFDGDLHWFTPGDFKDDFILRDSQRKLSNKAKEDGVAVITPENTTLIVGIGATAGKIGYATVESSFNQQITAIYSDKVFSKYLMYWMTANTKFLRETALFTTLPILNNQTIGSYLLVFPKDYSEQMLIAETLDKKCSEIDLVIAKKQAIVEKLTEYKKSLIYEVVTGKKEV